MVWRKMSQLKLTLGMICILGIAMSTATEAIEPNPDAVKKESSIQASALGVRQQRVKRMMQSLDRKFQDLAQKLRKTEPEQAELLIKAFQQSQERLIETRMSEISKLLDSAKLGEADAKQNEVLLELDDLLRVLLDRSKDWDKVNKEAERLEEMRKSVQDLLKKQRDHLRETDRLANKDRTLQDMDEKIREMEKLVEQQSELEKQTDAASKKATPSEKDMKKLAEDQKKLQEKTDELAKGIGPPEETPNEQASKTPATKPNEATPKDSKPNEAKPNSANAGQPGANSGQPGTKECKACLGKASQSQKSASQKLAKQLPKDAQKDEKKAVENLQKAIDALKKERDRIARLPKEMLDEMAKKQDATNQEANKLLDEMKESPDSKSKNGAKGEKNVQQAQKSMKNASEGLRGEDLQAAAEEQENAVEELKKALDEIEQRLAQLREDTLIDRLARLEARFRDMLARQQEVTKATAAIHAKRGDSDRVSRADRIKLRKLAAEELALAEEAYQTIDILVEDGTSVVFPRVVTGLKEDLEVVSKLLTDQRTDDYTQGLQAEAELTLQELIDALRKNLKKKKGGGGGGACDCEPPLLPGSAELKLLRSMQKRVYRRTTSFDKLSLDGELDEMMRKEVETLSELQEEVAEMALELAEKY